MSVCGKFIVIEGIDGAGKTSTAQYLSNISSDWLYLSSKDGERSRSYLNDTLQNLSRIVWPLEELKQNVHQVPQSSWLYLHAAWHHLFSQSVLLPHLVQGRNIVMDGYYYKFYAKMQMNGEAVPNLDHCFSSPCIPDLVVFLQLNPELAWIRKTGNLSSYEMGSLFNGTKYENIGKESFIDYQQRLSVSILKIMETKKIATKVLQVTQRDSLPEVASRVKTIVENI